MTGHRVPARSAPRWMSHGPFALSLSKGGQDHWFATLRHYDGRMDAAWAVPPLVGLGGLPTCRLAGAARGHKALPP